MTDETWSRWTLSAARAWDARLPWLVGCNFIPSTAVNQLEMWQAERFDLVTFNRELALAGSIGMNCIRIYLHDLLWLQDAAGFIARIDVVLGVAAAHGLRVIFVLFDSCWDSRPVLGRQAPPRAGVHNSGWVQSPGMAALADPAERDRLETYIKGVVGHFANDPRVLAWDIWNEPDNGPEVARRDPFEIAAKSALVLPLLAAAFDWARAVNPSQPLTSGVWFGDWSGDDQLSPTQALQLDRSDIVSFHNYDTPDDFATRVGWLRRLNRPILCTEFMARPRGSTFAAILPLAEAGKVAAICWGLVAGKTQTTLPWDSWDHPYVDRAPGRWFHDVFESDGTPYDASEVALIQSLAKRWRPT